jgi:dienelactone hydrolase
MINMRASRSNLVISLLVLAVCWAGCAQDSPAAARSSEPAPAATSGGEAGSPAVATRSVDYTAGGITMRGFLAYPAHATDKRPGVLVVHEWWGLNDYARRRAKDLAALGYVALAIDMFGDGKVATHPEEAKKFAHEASADPVARLQRFEAARAVLAADEHVDGQKLAAIGYCFGGGIVLNAARSGSKLDAVASFHGSLDTDKPMPASTFSGRIFVATGAADPFVPADQVGAFRKEMDAASAKYEVVEYPGAKHAFTNPEATEVGKQNGLPLEYNAEADTSSWQKLRELLVQVWGPVNPA